MNTHHPFKRSHGIRRRAFTFVEALMTIAILGIMASVLVTAFSSTSTDASRMIARQQQAAVQAAVNSWVNGETNRVNVIDATAGTAKLKTIEEIRAAYNNSATTLARLNLVGEYLDSTTLAHLTDTDYTTGAAKVKSEALASSKQYLTLPDWAANSYPQVVLNKE
jgi:prepilin-type N-terminal cleavage/methylation domain-containing protein